MTSLVFLGSRPDVDVSAEGETAHRANFILGDDPARWRTDIPTSSAIRYNGLYPGIDLKVYGSGRQVEYDWVVAPGADPAAIRFRYERARKTRLDAEGNLVVDSRPAKSRIRSRPRIRTSTAAASPRLPVRAAGRRRLWLPHRPLRPPPAARHRPAVIVWSSFIGARARTRSGPWQRTPRASFGSRGRRNPWISLSLHR